MGVLTFRTPQEGLDQFKNAVDLISIIRTIATDTSVGETIDDLSQKLSNAQELSEAKKKSVFEAEETISQAKDAVEELDKIKKQHSEEIESDFQELDSKRKSLQDDLANFEKSKKELLQFSENSKKDSDLSLENSKKLNEETKLMTVQLQISQDQLQISKNDLAAKISEFEKMKVQILNELSQKRAALEVDLTKLTADQSAFELRKKKFEDALKG